MNEYELREDQKTTLHLALYPRPNSGVQYSGCLCLSTALRLQRQNAMTATRSIVKA